MVNNELKLHARNIRRKIVEAGHKAGAMHFGGALSMVEAITYLYGEEMRYDAKNPEWAERDRFILSKGHCGLALYATLCEFGIITEAQLMTVDSNGGDFPSHPVMNVGLGVESTTGSLGLGTSFAIGQLLALEGSSRIFVLTGNGEVNEGSFWEAAMFAGARGLDRLCVTIDDNCMQLDGASMDVLPVANWTERLAAFGWAVADAEGHDFDSLRAAYQTPRNGKPLAVVAHTVKGKGVSFMENAAAWHHNKMTEEQYQQALVDIGGVA